MKYEMIFGDERLFDGASEFVEVIRFNDYSRDFLWGDLNTIQLLTFEELKAIPIVAMRRIIAEPKRWTRADKDAGRSPVYGAILESNDGSRVKFLAENNRGLFHCQYDDGSICAYLPKFFKPIETPAERAQREEDEWVNKAWSETAVFAGVTKDEHDRLRIHLRHIYRAQLSGELQAPKGGE